MKIMTHNYYRQCVKLKIVHVLPVATHTALINSYTKVFGPSISLHTLRKSLHFHGLCSIKKTT